MRHTRLKTVSKPHAAFIAHILNHSMLDYNLDKAATYLGSSLLGVDRHEVGPVVWFYWCQVCHGYAPAGGGDSAVRKVSSCATA